MVIILGLKYFFNRSAGTVIGIEKLPGLVGQFGGAAGAAAAVSDYQGESEMLFDGSNVAPGFAVADAEVGGGLAQAVVLIDLAEQAITALAEEAGVLVVS